MSPETPAGSRRGLLISRDRGDHHLVRAVAWAGDRVTRYPQRGWDHRPAVTHRPEGGVERRDWDCDLQRARPALPGHPEAPGRLVERDLAGCPGDRSGVGPGQGPEHRFPLGPTVGRRIVVEEAPESLRLLLPDP